MNNRLEFMEEAKLTKLKVRQSNFTLAQHDFDNKNGAKFFHPVNTYQRGSKNTETPRMDSGDLHFIKQSKDINSTRNNGNMSFEIARSGIDKFGKKMMP